MVNAQIPNGSWVLVRQPTVDNGDIAAVWIEDEGGTVKRCASSMVKFCSNQKALTLARAAFAKPEQVRIIAR